MTHRRRQQAQAQFDYWPAVADIFIGFLALMLLAGSAAYIDALERTETGVEPPVAKEDFRLEFEAAFAAELGGHFIAPDRRPTVRNRGFSELNIYFPAAFLFSSCRTDLLQPAADELHKLKILLRTFDSEIQRVQITGHTDTDRPSPGGLCYDLNIKTNWELSARRAITVLELLAPDDRSGLNPRKVWAAALGEYHPVDEEDKDRNRRIEILVRFKEGR